MNMSHVKCARVGDVDGYFVGWRRREFLMISPEERAKL